VLELYYHVLVLLYMVGFANPKKDKSDSVDILYDTSLVKGQ
jgi:hypothetical protein